MTVKELYEYCKELKIEDYPIFVDYTCGDDYYSFEEYIEEKNVDYGKRTAYGENLPTDSLVIRIEG